MSEYVVIYEAPKPSTGARGGWNGRDHTYVSRAESPEDAVSQVIKTNPYWADGLLWAVEATALTRVDVSKHYDFKPVTNYPRPGYSG